MNNPSTVNGLDLNQDASMFTCSLADGVRVYNVEPLMEKLRLDFEQVGSISKAAMYYRTNVMALLSGAPKPKFGAHQVMVWDTRKNDIAVELTFSSDVSNVLLCRGKLVAVLQQRVYVFSFPDDAKQLLELDTRANPHGVCALVTSNNKQVSGCWC